MSRNINSVSLHTEELEGREVPALVYGVTFNNQLVSFDSNVPTALLGNTPIRGLMSPTEHIVSIDVRPDTGGLYGRSDTGRLYIITPATGLALPIGGPIPTVAARAGFDFDPAADTIRVVSNKDENIRINANYSILAGADAPLAYRAGDAGQGQAPRIVAAAYSNNVPLASTTTLYGIDYQRDTLVTIGNPSASDGSVHTVGSLGVPTTAIAGLDIAGTNNVAFAAVNIPGQRFSEFGIVNLGTGAMSLLGPIGGGILVSDIAVAPGAPGTPIAVTPGISGTTTGTSLFGVAGMNPNGFVTPGGTTSLNSGVGTTGVVNNGFGLTGTSPNGLLTTGNTTPFNFGTGTGLVSNGFGFTGTATSPSTNGVPAGAPISTPLATGLVQPLFPGAISPLNTALIGPTATAVTTPAGMTTVLNPAFVSNPALTNAAFLAGNSGVILNPLTGLAQNTDVLASGAPSLFQPPLTSPVFTTPGVASAFSQTFMPVGTNLAFE